MNKARAASKIQHNGTKPSKANPAVWENKAIEGLIEPEKKTKEIKKKPEDHLSSDLVVYPCAHHCLALFFPTV